MRAAVATNRAGALALASAVLAGALALAGCIDAGPQLFEVRLYSMGTWVDLTLEAPSAAAADAAVADVETMLRRFEVDYYAWADGELGRLNARLRAGEEADVSVALARLLEAARTYSARSEGAFDPAVGELVEMWGFHSAPAPNQSPPRPEAIDAWLRASPGIDDLTIDGTRVGSANRRVKLDLGGIAKGAAVDRILELLRGRGVRNALVNAGGDLRVIGTKEGRPWRVGIKSPRADGVLGVIELADGEAAFTSGDYERFYERGGKRMHHILDPRTGYPAAGTEAVTVIARDGVVADASATALFVAGPDRWRRVARALGVDEALRVDTSGVVEVTLPMSRRLSGSAAERVDVVVVES